MRFLMSSQAKPIGFFGVIVLVFAVIAAIELFKSDDKDVVKRIDNEGVVGIWYDEVGDAETKIEKRGYAYRLKRVNGEGSKGDYPLTRDGDWLNKNDSLGTKYQIIGDRLDIHDNSGFIRSIELKPAKK